MAARAKLSGDGYWYCLEYRDGERHMESFGRGGGAKKLAEDAAERINAERVLERRGLLRTSTGMRLATYAAEWLRDVVEPHKAPGTTRNYRQLLEDHVLPELGALALSDIRAHVLKAFIAKKLKEARSVRNKSLSLNPPRGAAAPVPDRAGERAQVGPPRARNTVRNMVAVLRALLSQAVEIDELLDTNPAAKFGKRFFEGQAASRGIHVEIYEEPELALILKTAKKLYPDYEIYLRTLFFTGLRLGELLGLQWPDWNYPRGLVTIRRAVRIHKGELLVADTKTHQVRQVDVPVELAARWKELREIREAEAAVAGRALARWCCPSVKRPHDRVDAQGTIVRPARPLNASWLNHKVWARVLEAAELRRLRVHDTRHTYAALMLRQGKSIEYVSQQLGHTKIDVTIRFYAHFKPGVNRHLANDFEARIRAHEEA